MMEQYEIERLINDIQDYLNRPEQEEVDVAELDDSSRHDDEGAGIFIENSSRKRMKRFLKLFQYAFYAVEILTISLFTAVMMFPFPKWPHTMMFLIGVLLFGIFTISLLLGLQARIGLLFKIESNTRQIAYNKARIAEALENIQGE
jgi:hypothetical protein